VLYCSVQSGTSGDEILRLMVVVGGSFYPCPCWTEGCNQERQLTVQRFVFENVWMDHCHDNAKFKDRFVLKPRFKVNHTLIHNSKYGTTINNHPLTVTDSRLLLLIMHNADVLFQTFHVYSTFSAREVVYADFQLSLNFCAIKKKSSACNSTHVRSDCFYVLYINFLT